MSKDKFVKDEKEDILVWEEKKKGDEFDLGSDSLDAGNDDDDSDFDDNFDFDDGGD